MPLDFQTLSLTEIIRLQNQLSGELSRRFERLLALAFSDIVGSTWYFSKYGNEAGHRLQRRHLDLLQQVLPPAEGRIVDTAGDGALMCFPLLHAAAQAFVRFHEVVQRDNAHLPQEQQLHTRTALHWGPVLTDGALVTGDAVNLCARIAESAKEGEIRLTRAAFLELPTLDRLRCHPLPPVQLKGFNEPVEIMVMDWRDSSRFPAVVRVEETGEHITLPDQAIITFGRLHEWNGMRANDIVLALPDPHLTQQISRWHFELHSHLDGLMLHQKSGQLTEVDGRAIAYGEQVPIGCGAVVCLSRVMTLRFLSARSNGPEAKDTGTHTMV